MNDLGVALRAYRNRLGLTLREVAKNLGISHVHLCNLELGKAAPSLQLLDRLFAEYGTYAASKVLANWLEDGLK